MASWSVTIDVERGEAEEVAAALMEEGAGGVEVRDGEGMPMPGHRASRRPGGRWWWPCSRTAAEAAAAAGERGGELEELPDQDWGERWKEGLDAAPHRPGLRPAQLDRRPRRRPGWSR